MFGGRNTAGPLAVLAFGLLLLGGCGTTHNIDRASQTAMKLDIFVANLELAKAQLDATVGAMNGIQLATDRVAAYKAFVKEVDKTASLAEKARERSLAMRKQGEAYFNSWLASDAGINDPELRSRSASRRDALAATFDTIRAASDVARANYDLLMGSVYDIQYFLGNDLSDGAFTAIAEFQQAATASSDSVKASLDALIVEAGTVREMLTPGANPDSSADSSADTGSDG